MSSVGGELQAEIVSIGTEMLLGEITDTNASWIARQLPALGIPLYRCQQVGDNRARLTATLAAAWDRANLLILTGGLGPTEDDVTREAISDLLGERMEVVPALETALRDFFARRSRQMPATNVKQATLIPSASTLANPIGTAPGWWVARDGRYLATMPGVPVEMRRMWREEVVPHLLALPRGGAIISRTLKILGIGESSVEEQLGMLVRSNNPTVATYAKNDGIHVRLAARAADRAEAIRLIAGMEARIRAIFGQSIYGADDENLADSAARLLASRGVSLAVAEAGLGGALCAALPGATLRGGLVLPIRHDTPDGPAAEAAAIELARRAGAAFDHGQTLAALVAPLDTERFRIAVAVDLSGEIVARSEEHRTDPSDAPRRAVLLAMQELRARLSDI